MPRRLLYFVLLPEVLHPQIQGENHETICIGSHPLVCAFGYDFSGVNTVYGCRATATTTGTKPSDHNRAEHY
jgi:hypothetical protein